MVKVMSNKRLNLLNLFYYIASERDFSSQVASCRVSNSLLISRPIKNKNSSLIYRASHEEVDTLDFITIAHLCTNYFETLLT